MSCLPIMVFKPEWRDVNRKRQSLGYSVEGDSRAEKAMSDLEEGEIEDGELPSEQPRVGSFVFYVEGTQESSYTGLWVWSKRVLRPRSRED